MDVYKVVIAHSAEKDLTDIARYISSQLNAPTTAINMVRTIRAAIAKLETNALLQPLVRDDRLGAMGYRPLTVKKYVVFYIAHEKEKVVAIDRILYARRNWQSIL